MICGDQQGTTKGASRHSNAGDPMCDPCRIARNEYHRDWSRRDRAKKRLDRDRLTIPSVVVDVLSTEARWLSSDVLIDLVRDRHPEFKSSSVQRAVLRLKSDGVIESRTRIFSFRDGLAGHAASGTLRTHEIAEYRADDEAWEALHVA